MMTSSKQIIGAALNPMGYTHFTDHLAAVAVTMQIPLIFTDINHFEQSQRLYPNLKVELHDWQAFTPSYIVEHYDVLYVSEMWDRKQLRSKFEQSEKDFKKNLRIVHCPHGFSDKGYWFERCLEQDITLAYGKNMLDLIVSRRPEASLPNYVITGNLRHRYYMEHREAFDKVTYTDVFSRFAKQQPTILYAPTWRDSEDSTSFFQAAEAILSGLPKHYNLIVKLHPNLEHDHDHMVDVYEIISKYENEPNVVMLTEFPLIYPLAAKCDIYIGDRSAVGYDWLTFKKPMFFLHRGQGQPYLSRCGVVIEENNFEFIYDVIEQSLPSDHHFKDIRDEVYNYTFGSERSFETVKQEVLAAITRPRSLSVD
jgi:hypothetical protein